MRQALGLKWSWDVILAVFLVIPELRQFIVYSLDCVIAVRKNFFSRHDSVVVEVMAGWSKFFYLILVWAMQPASCIWNNVWRRYLT